MSDRLTVDPDGLIAASGTVTRRADESAAVGSAHPIGGKSSSLGAARVSAAINSFGAACASRYSSRALSLQLAAMGYLSGDDDSASRVRDASV